MKHNIQKRTSVMPSKIPQSKRYEYIKKIEVDGYPRIRAYAEVIDKEIYNMTPAEATHKLEYIRESWEDYNTIKETVLAERADWNLRRSAAAQDKAMELLNCTLDKAIELVKDPETDVKAFSAAVNTLKTIMPALTKNESAPVEASSVKRNAAKYIN